MCRRVDLAISIVGALALVAPANAQRPRTDLAPGAPAERRVEQYLAERDLLEPLAAQLRARLERAAGEERVEIAERLAEVYVSLLTRAESGAERARWEQAGRGLLASVPEADSLDLRLDLHRATYARAEEIAERWRVGLASPAEREEAIATFESLERELAAIGRETDRRVIQLQRQEERAGREVSDLLVASLASARRQRSLAMYLAGWCNTYLADITDTPGRAEEALRQLGWLLGSEPNKPASLRRLPRNFLRYEHIARSALGVAVCSALLGRDGEAVAWMDAVDRAENLPTVIREQLPIWRMVIDAELNRWRDLEEAVAARRTDGDSDRPLAPGEARLLATIALRADPPARDLEVVERLRAIGVADLVRRGELSSVVELGREWGAGAFGDRGFVPNCVRGLLAYEQARELRDEAPGRTDEMRRRYEQAAQALSAAMNAPDASRFGAAAGEVAMTLGLSRYALGTLAEQAATARFASAADAFERAAELLGDTERSGEAIWMAVRSLDEAADAGAAIEESRRAALVERYLDRFPQSPRAGALLLREAVDSDASTEETIARLQSIPAGSDAHESARRHIARLLYDQFREAPDGERDWAALRYADAAEPLLADDLRAAIAGDSEAAQRAAARARRVLAALLATTAPDAQRAERTLSALLQLIGAGMIERAPIDREIRYREAQIAIARDDLQRAGRIMGDLRSDQPEDADRLAASLARSIYRRATLRWRAAQRTGAGVEAAARLVVEVGSRLLESESAGAPEARLAIEAGVAEAWRDLWLVTGDEAALEEALRRHAALAQQGVTDPDFLRRFAELGEDAGDLDTAIDAWRTLSAGIERTAPAWFEARWQLVRLVEQVDRPRALSLLDQHAILYPDYGPAPWGERLRSLHQRLAQDSGGEEDAGGAP